MKQKNRFVSRSRRAIRKSEGEHFALSKTRRSAFDKFRSGRDSDVSLVNLSRLLIPFFVLISTTCCTTTSSLSPLGLYKVGIGATNLIENILGSTGTRTKTVTTDISNDSIESTAGGIISESRRRSSTSNNISKNKNKNKNKKINSSITNKKKRRDKNKNSLKRSNSVHKKKIATEENVLGVSKQNTDDTNRVPGDNNNDEDEDDEDEDDDDDDMLRIVGVSEDDQKFLHRVQASARTVQSWDADEELLKKCRSQIPWNDLIDDWDSENNEKNGERKYSKLDEDRFLRACSGADSNALFLQRLCRWFQSYMTWVNAPPCKVCGCKETEMKAVRGPETSEEEEGEAKRVEVYYCPQCKANTTTFPRYNKAGKLLETRQGRCGEYANLFGLFCRSVGFETRLVLDWSDHLWTEVRLGDNWVMADGCEGVIDKPSMYEHGWGKSSLSYMIGIGCDHVVDATPRYTRQFMTTDFQTRRREHTMSEEVSESMLQKLNEYMRTNPTILPKSRAEELRRRQKLEYAELQQYKQATEWTEQEKYGSGRISGSIAWKRSRHEDGSIQSQLTESSSTTLLDREVAGFPVEAFMPTRLQNGTTSLQLRARPSSRHDGIVVSNTPCAVGVKNAVSVVVVDDNIDTFGCILQSKSFVDWPTIVKFIDSLPTGRIVLMNGKIEIGNETKAEDFYTEVKIGRLGGWIGDEVVKRGVLFAGQIDAHPDWTFCRPLENGGSQTELRNGYEYEIELDNDHSGRAGKITARRLRTQRGYFPQRIAGRLPEAFMPLVTQQNPTHEKEKREAYLKFAKSHGGRYCGYTTKKNSPVYLLDSTAYPLQRVESTTANILENDDMWNTFLELPEPLVPSSDCGIENVASKKSYRPNYDVPLDSNFFKSSLGPILLSNTALSMDTADVLENARLVALYFSAHWCGPCRSFTPMLAELYDHLHEKFPTHGLEIVFVSSDRDEQSFNQYYQKMPWKAIPFDQLQFVKQALNVTYGVRGIPSLVVLDAVSGEVVVPASESRQEVVTACRGGDLRIEAMFQSWLGRTPGSSKELLSMLELSAREIETKAEDRNQNDPDQNPYLKRMIDGSERGEGQDISIRFKAEFEKLVTAGHDPNSAAATALTTVSKISVDELVTTISPGKLDGKAIYAGESGLTRSQDNVEQALEYALDRNSASIVSEVLSTGRKYLKNSMKSPWESKFRRFKLSNKVADKITRVEGGLGLLQSLGFEVIGTHRDFEASIPVAADLTNMDAKIAKLLEDLNAPSS